ncbi:hypothetical protein TRVA0_006S00628 [Trichomonascus vanleenenianus]|uniref:uncharacterized protein n=1 Tax=Trichomonascus vanleenenianus TaxID=2268995 RepID=UPI003ECA8600
MKFASFGILNIYLGEFPKGHLPISRLLKVVWSGDFPKKVFLYGDDKRSPSMAHRMLKWKTPSSDVELSIYSKSAAHIPLCSVGFDFKNYYLGNAFGRYLHALSIKIDDSTHVAFNYALTDCKRLAKLAIFYSVRYQARLVLTESIESLAVHGWFRQLHISKQKGTLVGLLLSRKGNSNPVQVFVPALKVLAITDIVKYGDGWMNGVVDTFADTIETLFIGRKQPSQLVHDPLEIPPLEPVMFIADDFGQSEAQEKMSRSGAHDNIYIDSRDTNTSIHRVYMALPFQGASTITKCAKALFRTAQDLQQIELFAGFLTQEHVDYLAEYSTVSGRRIVIERENLIGQAH